MINSTMTKNTATFSYCFNILSKNTDYLAAVQELIHMTEKIIRKLNEKETLIYLKL